MSDEAFPFATTTEVLMALAVGDALKAIAKPECPAFGYVFLERARVAEASADHEVARARALLPIFVGRC